MGQSWWDFLRFGRGSVDQLLKAGRFSGWLREAETVFGMGRSRKVFRGGERPIGFWSVGLLVEA